jgi:hypothetical protein
MQVLDQHIMSSWPITEKGTNVFDRPGVGLASLWVAPFAISGIELRGPAPAQGRIGIQRFVSRNIVAGCVAGCRPTLVRIMQQIGVETMETIWETKPWRLPTLLPRP